jgi:hypothetical protein
VRPSVGRGHSPAHAPRRSPYPWPQVARRPARKYSPKPTQTRRGPPAPRGVPTDFCDQLGEARRILAWLAGSSDGIPVDDDNRGRLIGARDDYAHSDEEICRIRDQARHGLDGCDLPYPVNPAAATDPWRWPAKWMKAAWLRGVRDLLDWVLGDRAASPLCSRIVGLPTTQDLAYEDSIAHDVVLQGRPGGIRVDPRTYPPPQYGEAIQATIRWLRGESTSPAVDEHGYGPYASPPG